MVRAMAIMAPATIRPAMPITRAPAPAIGNISASGMVMLGGCATFASAADRPIPFQSCEQYPEWPRVRDTVHLMAGKTPLFQATREVVYPGLTVLAFSS